LGAAEEAGQAGGEAELEARLRLDDLKAFLFPYRTHLESEIAWLKAQLAQERRRVDVLIEKPEPKPVTARGLLENKPARRAVPLGWDATRAEGRNATRDAEVPARPDTRGEGQAEDQRTTA
jgi:hypothetical protein